MRCRVELAQILLEFLARLDRYVHFLNVLTLYEIVDGGEIFTNGVLNVRKRFSFGVTLGPATG